MVVWVFPERGGGVESGEAAADRGLAGAAVAVAREQRYRTGARQWFAFVVPGGEEAAELGRDGERTAPWSSQDGAVARESAQVGQAEVVRAACEHGDGDQRGELWSGVWSASAAARATAALSSQGRVSPKQCSKTRSTASMLVSTPARSKAPSAARMRT
jgi:hypothetical protein